MIEPISISYADLQYRVVHSYSTEKGKIWVVLMKEEVTFLLEIEKRLKKIEEIIALPFATLTEDKIQNYLQLSYPKLAQLSDGSYKLYLLGGLKGGGKIGLALKFKLFNAPMWKWEHSDWSLSYALTESLNKKITGQETKVQPFFISIKREVHNFLGTEKDARKLSFRPNPLWKVHNFILSPLTSYFFGMLNVNAAAEAILGSDEYDDQQALKNIFFKNKSLIIYVSRDLQEMDVECQ